MVTRPIATQFPWIYLIMDLSDDPTTERSFDSQATWVIGVIDVSLWHIT